MSRSRHTRLPAEAVSVLQAWHRGLEEDRGSRAQLRRLATFEGVVLVPAYHRLLRRLEEALGEDALDRERLAQIAGLLAHVEEHDDERAGNDGKPLPLPTQMARPRKEGSRPRVSTLRFRRLLAAETAEERYTHLVRVIRLLDRRLNATDLAQAVYRWDRDPELRRRWAYSYYRVVTQNEPQEAS